MERYRGHHLHLAYAERVFDTHEVELPAEVLGRRKTTVLETWVAYIAIVPGDTEAEGAAATGATREEAIARAERKARELLATQATVPA